MKLGVVSYCPPVGVLNSDAFMANLSKYPARHPLYLLSDDPKRNPSRVIKSPELIGRRPQWALNNWLWFEALALARDLGLDAFIYLESDSRVYGDGWDDIVFAEYWKRYPNGIACAGTMVCWDVSSGGREFAMNVIAEAYAFQQAAGIPMSFYSARDPRDCSGAALYVNGSGAVFDTAAMLAVFGGFEKDLVAYSKCLTAWDLAIGRCLWNYHGPRCVHHVGWLTKTVSCFGDCVLNSDERKELLLSGRCSMIHQIKSDWTP